MKENEANHLHLEELKDQQDIQATRLKALEEKYLCWPGRFRKTETIRKNVTYWPARKRALAIVSAFSLGLFLVMSLMTMQLWTIAGLAGPLLIILLLQAIAGILFILLVLFPLMGRDYQAAFFVDVANAFIMRFALTL